MARFVEITTEWFAVPDDADGAKLKIKYLTPGQEQELELDALSVAGSSDSATANVSFDIGKKRQLVVTKTITDWSGFFDRKGKESKCTKDNLLKALSEFDWFFDFVEESRATLRKNVEKEKGEAGKN